MADYRNREDRDGRPVEACRVRSESSTLSRGKESVHYEEKGAKSTSPALGTHLGRDAPAPVVVVAVAVEVE